VKTRKNWLAPAIFAGLVVSLSVTLLTIGARSPYTHLNLSAGVVSGYDRTTQTLVGPPQSIKANAMVTGHGDLSQQGAALFMNLDCASCHGIKGQGGVVGPVIAGVNATLVQQKTAAGPGGMPKFTGLSDQDVQALAAYLVSVTKAPGSN
jgi:cytochrome c553